MGAHLAVGRERDLHDAPGPDRPSAAEGKEALIDPVCVSPRDPIRAQRFRTVRPPASAMTTHLIKRTMAMTVTTNSTDPMIRLTVLCGAAIAVGRLVTNKTTTNTPKSANAITRALE